jgi:hypothetical protein
MSSAKYGVDKEDGQPIITVGGGLTVAKKRKDQWRSTQDGWSVLHRDDGIYVQYNSQPPLKPS